MTEDRSLTAVNNEFRHLLVDKKDVDRLEHIKLFNFGLEQEQIRDQLREFGMVVN